VLPRAHRVVQGDDFRRAVRRGRRTSSAHAVVYRLVGEADGPRFGVIVSKQVGGAVVRNRVRRRILSICASALSEIPSSDLIVIRALPGAHEAPWDTLRTEIGDGLRRAVTAS
jgi:ribonuclease P protein component